MGNILIHAIGVGIAGDVQPVSPPALSITGRRQQVVDKTLPGVRLIIENEGLYLLRGGWQAMQVQIGPSHQSAAACYFRWSQAGLLHP